MRTLACRSCGRTRSSRQAGGTTLVCDGPRGTFFEVTAAGETHRVTPGQMLWIPEGTELVYGGHALFGYALYPGNWKALHGME